MCISRRAPVPKKSTVASLKDEDVIVPTSVSWKQLAHAESSVATTTSDCESLTQNDTETTASLSSNGSSNEISLSDILGDEDFRYHSQPFCRSRSNSTVSWGDNHQRPMEEEHTNDSSPEEPIRDKSAIQEKRKHLTSLQKSIFQRLDSMTSYLHEDAPTSGNIVCGETSTTSNATLLSTSTLDAPFESKFEPCEMRCLALLAQDHMKPSLLDFVQTHRELLKKFRLTGPKDTVDVLRSVYGNNDALTIVPCQVTPGYNAEAHLAVQICLHQIGGVLFFTDPLAPAQQAGANAVLTMANRHNVLIMSNPTTATAMSRMLRLALKEGRRELAASFFENCSSPAVEEYKRRQKNTLKESVVVQSMLDATLLMTILSPTKT